MSKTPKFSFLLIFLITFIFLLNTAIGMCEVRSRTWHGRCRSPSHCDAKCQQREKAVHGTCHGFLHRKCYCYYEDCIPVSA
uniref:Defensin 5 n=1 Tax=Datisca glomerata TaxID=34297 RepID=A0A6M3RI04_DATGL|nr:defensin 5 [Datisca glomerata]